MPSTISSLAAKTLVSIRQNPRVHRVVHGIAVAVSKTPFGARFIRNVLDDPMLVRRDYEAWAYDHEHLGEEDRAAVLAHIAAFKSAPLISVVMPAYATPPELLAAAIESVQAQIYPHWELCIADDASPGGAVWKVMQRYAKRDRRIKVVRRTTNGHICAATNSALALATGDFVALMDHDDLLPLHALYEVAALIDRHPDADIIYSDEDKVDQLGKRSEPYFKTDWNYDLLLGQNMVSHLGVYRRSLVEAVGGLREGFEGSQDYDLTLRVSEKTSADRIHHIPCVLYHWRQQGETASFSERQLATCADAARRAVQEHLERTGQAGAEAANIPDMPGWVRVKRPVPTPAPLVSIIVPTRDRAELMGPCADGVLNQTDYPALELLIVDNGSTEPDALALFERLKSDPRVRIIDAPGPFNFSALNNRAVREAKGEILVLLNNDISMEDDGWLREMVSHAVRPNVGAVGAKLNYPDGTVQHAGVVLGVGGVAAHFGPGAGGKDVGYFGHLAMVRNVSAVTAACLALRKSVFEEVGGLDEDALKVAFNDVDLCLKIRAKGYDIVWTPHAVLTHHESASRGSDQKPGARERFAREVEVMRTRWSEVLVSDPFYGPNFDNRYTDYRLAERSARAQPWKASTHTATRD